MHADSFRIMINRNINTVSGCQFYPGGCTATTGEVVNYQFSVYHFLQKEPGAPFIRIGSGSFLSIKSCFFTNSLFYVSSKGLVITSLYKSVQ